MTLQTGINANATTPLALGLGGTSASLTASNGGIVFTDATKMQVLAPNVNGKHPLLSGPSTAPEWGLYPIDLGGDLVTESGFTITGPDATFNMSGPTNVNFPTSGTLATTSQLPAAAALTTGNDTNITLTAGGGSATALLQASSITAGWTGQLSMARGGTAKSLTPSNGGIVYTDADSMEILAANVAANKILMSGASSAPTWSTSTYPATSAINSILYASAANIIGNLAPQNNGVLTTGATGIPAWLTGGTVFTPTITFFVPGDLSVVYTSQVGRYWRLADLIITKIDVAFTPTYTTAASGFIFSLPVPVATLGNVMGIFYTPQSAASANFTFPAGTTTITPIASAGTSGGLLSASGSGVSSSGIMTAHIPSGTAQRFFIFCIYYA